MLLDFREKIRSSKPLKYSLITLICIPFVLFGVGSYFSGGSAPTVASVNGEEITQLELDRATQRQRQQLAQLFGGQLPQAFADETALRRQALDQLVTQRVLAETVAEQRFAVGDATLGRAIRELPAFLDEEQRFDPELYERQVRASGLSISDFEQSFRDDTAMNQFRVGVVDTSFTLPSEAERLDALARQTRTIDGVRFDLDVARAAIEPTEQEIAAHFEENADSYRFPERAKIDWIELSSETLAAGIEIDDEEIEARYEDNRASYVRPEQREASHILLNLDPDADESEVDEKRETLLAARESVVGDASPDAFAALARELSDDIGSAESGGSLGLISPGAMVPEFEEAVFALAEEGAVSEPVRTDFGLHLIRLDRIVPEEGRALDEVREEIREELRLERADREFFDLRGDLAELVFDESDSLEPAAEETGLEVRSSDWLDVDTIADAGPILSNPLIFAAMNDLEVREESNNSELIEIGDRQVVALRVTESEGERPKTLDEVREQVIDEIRSARAGERLDTLSEEALAAIVDGEAVADIAAANGVDAAIGASDEVATDTGDTSVAEAEAGSLAEAIEGEVLTRDALTFDAGVVREIFALPHPTDEAPRTVSTVLADGDRLVYALRSVDVPPAPADETDAAGEAEGASDSAPAALSGADAAMGGADPRLGNVEFEALLGSIRSRADVDLSP